MAERTIHIETELPSTPDRVEPAGSMKHGIEVLEVGEDRCRDSDTAVIEAGHQTAAARWIATRIDRYGQRRWHRLVRNHLMPTGPRHAVTPVVPAEPPSARAARGRPSLREMATTRAVRCRAPRPSRLALPQDTMSSPARPGR